MAHPTIDDDGEAYSESPSEEPLLAPSPFAGSPQHAPSIAVFRRAAVFMAFHFCIAFCEMVLVAPLLALFERSICLVHFTENDPSLIGSGGWVDEAQCKIPIVQRELAYVRGWKGALDTLPVFLVAVPMGKLADRYGRRQLLSLNLAGVLAAVGWIMIVCAFPIVLPLRLVWASSIILCCGGGLYTTAALMWAMVSNEFDDITRSKAFYYIFSAFYIAELVASGLASLTIDISPWIGCMLAISSIIGAMILLILIPSSVPASSAASLGTLQSQSSTASTFKQALSNPNILFSLPVFLVGALRYTVLNVLMQYASVQFGIPISKTALIYTETAIVTVTMFLIIVPKLTTLYHSKYEHDAIYLDLGMVRISVSLLCIGSLFIALSNDALSIFFSVFIFAAGFGSRVSMLALISYWTSDDAKGGFYAAIAVLENIGHAVGDPSLQHIYAAVLDGKGLIRSLPFLVASTLYGLAVAASYGMSVKRTYTRSHSA